MSKNTRPHQSQRRSTPPFAKPGEAHRRLAAQRAAAARERIAQAQRRRQLYLVTGAVLGVLVVVGALIAVKVATGAGGPRSGQKETAATTGVLAKVEAVPLSALNTIGAGSIQTPPSPLSAPALTDGGRPEVFYAGAEYCPFCAAERWAIAVAVSRFGTLTGVGQTASSPTDEFPNTQTLSFHGSTLASRYITLTAKELNSNQVVNGQWASLDRLDARQQAVYDKYDNKPFVPDPGSIPFVDIGGQYVISGASYDPGVLQHRTHAQIADALSDPSSPVARAIDGTANVITAAICTATHDQPARVCGSAGVRAGADKLSSRS